LVICGNPRVHDKVDQVISEVYSGIGLLLVVKIHYVLDE